MTCQELLIPENTIGKFGNFIPYGGQGLEFLADLILPYRKEFQSMPMRGQFILIQLETPYEALLARITSPSSSRNFSADTREYRYLLAQQHNGNMMKLLHEESLFYRINLHILGVLSRINDGTVIFASSHRRFPCPGNDVAFPTIEILREIAGHNSDGVAIGHLALGEYVYSEERIEYQCNHWMTQLSPEVVTRFPITSLVSRRSFIFARAGFGKSNLNKLLFSELYKNSPTIESRKNEKVPVGTIIFDPDGEYFWPDKKGRPGLCDVPELQHNVVVFTDREAPSDFYQSFVAGGIKLDLRKMEPRDVLSVALSSQKQDQQNIKKLKDLDHQEWVDLIDLIDQYKNDTPVEGIIPLLHLRDKRQENEAVAARSNMSAIVQLLHDNNSRILEMLTYALAHGKLCIIDISLLHDADALILTGLILRYIFNINQKEFTKKRPSSNPVIAVIEEAQSVLTGNSSASVPHRDWVKEGRKYDLGSVLITQQPGSIPKEILSQGDNWFVLHLLSARDLLNLQNANAYFSQDIVSLLLNEPMPGHGAFWSSVSNMPYPIPLRVLSFEHKYEMLDPNYDKSSISTFVQMLKYKCHQPPSLEQWAKMHTSDSDYLEIANGSKPYINTNDDYNF